jgi:hypothetical protein
VEPIDAAIIEPSFRSAALEECGRQFIAQERQTWYELEEKHAVDEVAELMTNEEGA